MAAFSVFWLILVPMTVVSIVVAVWPLRSARLRIWILVGHITVSLLLIFLLDGPRPLWVILLGPGLLIAVARLAAAALADRPARRAG